MGNIVAFLDAWHPFLWGDKLFRTDHEFNRDDCTRPWLCLKEAFEARGVEVHTADMLLSGKIKGATNLYLSIGQRDNYTLLRHRPDVRLAAYFQLEPPVVDPAGYKALPILHQAFERVYTHNPELFGGTKLYWPQVKDGFIPEFFGQRPGKLCMINSNKGAHTDFDGLGGPELYSERRRALEALGDRIDVYGPGWEGLPNWKGAPPDKFAVLRNHDYCLCFENQAVPGYVTEKIFEAMFAGCVPVYLGAGNITDYVPHGCFVDMRDMVDYQHLLDFLANANPDFYRGRMAQYFASDDFVKLFTSANWAHSVVDAIL